MQRLGAHARGASRGTGGRQIAAKFVALVILAPLLVLPIELLVDLVAG